jgi:aminopeptidase YwaD
MNPDNLIEKIEAYLRMFCLEIPGRRVGSSGNQNATAYFSQVLREFQLEIQAQRFDCLDYRTGSVSLTAGLEKFAVQISPYSPGCVLEAELAAVSRLEELKDGNFKSKILLLKGDLTKEQLMPKNFVFYNPESHQMIYRLLENQQPAAILTATGRNPELAGAPYPFPMIEDGDFHIPSVYCTDTEGERLSSWIGKPVQLKMEAERIHSWSENITTQMGANGSKRIVVCAHIDAKDGTPGAVDNASGVIVLLLLAEILKNTSNCPPVELLAINGEDHYSAGGEMEYLKRNQDKLADIRLMINVDGAGYCGHPSAVSFYNCPEAVEQLAGAGMSNYASIIAGDPWFQSDHMVFAMNQVPAMAITTSQFMDMERYIAHTALDRMEKVDPVLLLDIAFYLKEFLMNLEGSKTC